MCIDTHSTVEEMDPCVSVCQVGQEGGQGGSQATGQQSEERARCCGSLSVPHRRLPVVPLGAGPRAEVRQPGLVRGDRGDSGGSSNSNGSAPVHSARAACAPALLLLPPRPAVLPDPAGGAEVPDLPPRQLLLRELLPERAGRRPDLGRRGGRLPLLQTLQPARPQV